MHKHQKSKATDTLYEQQQALWSPTYPLSKLNALLSTPKTSPALGIFVRLKTSTPFSLSKRVRAKSHRCTQYFVNSFPRLTYLSSKTRIPPETWSQCVRNVCFRSRAKTARMHRATVSLRFPRLKWLTAKQFFLRLSLRMFDTSARWRKEQRSQQTSKVSYNIVNFSPRCPSALLTSLSSFFWNCRCQVVRFRSPLRSWLDFRDTYVSVYKY